jgi:hypothetical protein
LSPFARASPELAAAIYVEKVAKELESKSQQKDGFWEGLSLGGRILVVVGLPCLGWVVAEIMGGVHKALIADFFVTLLVVELV